MVLLVNVAFGGEVGIAADIKDRDARETKAAVSNPAGLVGGAKCLGIGDGTEGDRISVVIIAADLLIQVEELGGRDGAGVEGGEAVLDAGVIDGAAGEARQRVAAIDIDGMVEDVAAGPGAVQCRMVAKFVGKLGGAELGRMDAAGAVGYSKDVGECPDTGDGALLDVRQGAAGPGEIVVEELGVDEELGGLKDIGESGAGDDAIEEARVAVGDLKLLIGTAGTASPKSEERRAVDLDEAFLDHHHGFGGDDILAVIAEDIEGG